MRQVTYNAHNAFIYGHYDSRGGASAILAQTKDEADKRYAASFYLDDPEQEASLIEEDFLYEATLWLPADLGLSDAREILSSYADDKQQSGEIYRLIHRDLPKPPDEDDYPSLLVDGRVVLRLVPADCLVEVRNWRVLGSASGLDVPEYWEQYKGNPEYRIDHRDNVWVLEAIVDENLEIVTDEQGQTWQLTELGEDACGVILYPEGWNAN